MTLATGKSFSPVKHGQALAQATQGGGGALTPGGVEEPCGCGTRGPGSVGLMADSVIRRLFATQTNSVIPPTRSKRQTHASTRRNPLALLELPHPSSSPLTVRWTQLPLWKVSYCWSSMSTLHSYQPWSSERTCSMRSEALSCRLARPVGRTQPSPWWPPVPGSCPPHTHQTSPTGASLHGIRP